MSDDDRERWNARYRDAPGGVGVVNHALLELSEWIPAAGSALELAAGRGGDAAWLAARGLDVVALDVSDVAVAHARDTGLGGGAIDWRRADLRKLDLPAGPFDLVTCSNYLQRNLWPAVAAVLRPGGRVIWVHPTHTNATRHAKPPARFLLAPGEAHELLAAAAELRVLWSDEGWRGPPASARHLARVVAERPEP